MPTIPSHFPYATYLNSYLEGTLSDTQVIRLASLAEPPATSTHGLLASIKSLQTLPPFHVNIELLHLRTSCEYALACPKWKSFLLMSYHNKGLYLRSLLDQGVNIENKYERDAYKQLPKSKLWVPRERFIRAKLAEFLAPVQAEVKGYIGNLKIKDDLEIKRKSAHLAVNFLKLFEGLVPDMKKGHIKDETQDSVDRCLTISDHDSGIIGAIRFIINYKSKECEIKTMEIENSHQKKNHGATLLQSAIFVSLLYGCHILNLTSTNDARQFYEKHGFVQKNKLVKERDLVEYEFNIRVETSCERLKERAQKTSLNFDFQQFLVAARLT